MDERDQEIRKLRADLDVALLAKGRLQSELTSAREISEERKNALNNALGRLQEEKNLLEEKTITINRMAEDIDTANRRYEETRATLCKKESTLQSLLYTHDQLRSQFNDAKKQYEEDKKALSITLEEATCKCEEQDKTLKQKIGEIDSLKSAVLSLEKKCSIAEALADEKAQMVRQLESDIESKEATLSIFSENKTHSEVLKVKLSECERSLAREHSLRTAAEKALPELKSRDEHLLQVEQAHSTLQQDMKWRKEQFGHLEEAYKKLQQQLKVRETEWEGEKSQMINEISSLHTKNDSLHRMTKDLELQLHRCNQALAHEESRRKILEIEAQESRHGFEKAAAECEEARSSIKNLTEYYSKEIGLLRNSLSSKERQLREKEVKISFLEQENRELQSKLDEFQTFRSGSEEVRDSFEKIKLKYSSMEVAYKECSETLKQKESEWNKEREDLHQALNNCHRSVESKEKKIQELRFQLGGALQSVETLTHQKAELSQRYTIFESESNQVQSKLAAQNIDLEACFKKKSGEVDCLNESLQAKTRAYERIEEELAQLKAKFNIVSEKCMSVERLERECLALKEELHGKKEQMGALSASRDLLQHQMSQRDKSFREENKRISETLEDRNLDLLAKDREIRELQSDINRLKEALKKAHEGTATSDSRAEEYLSQLQAMQEELSKARTSLAEFELKIKTDKETFTDAITSRDKMIDELNNQLLNLQQSVNEVSEKERCLTDIKQQCKQLELQRLQDVRSLDVLNRKLEAATKQVAIMEDERERLVANLCNNESDLSALRSDNKTLISEKTVLRESLQSLEQKYSKLVDEYNSQKLLLQEAYENLEVVRSEVGEQEVRIEELQAEVKHLDVVREELLINKTKMQRATFQLDGAQESVLRKNERISELEIEVEQLKTQIRLLKHDIGEKEKDEEFLKETISCAQTDLTAKEAQVAQLNAELVEASERSKEKDAEIQRLCDELNDMKERISKSNRSRSDIEAKLKRVEGTLKDKETALESARRDIQKEKQDTEDLKVTVEDLQRKLITEERISSDRQAEVDSLRGDLDRLELSEKLSFKKLEEREHRLFEIMQDCENYKFKMQETITALCSSEHTLNEIEKKTNIFEDRLRDFKKILQSEVCKDRSLIVCVLLEEQRSLLCQIRLDTISALKECRCNVQRLKDASNDFLILRRRLETFQSKENQDACSEIAGRDFQGQQSKLVDVTPQLQCPLPDFEKQKEDLELYMVAVKNAEKEISVWKDRVASVEGLNNMFRSEIERTNTSLNEISKNLEVSEDNRSHLQEKVNVLDRQVQSLSLKLSSAEKDIALRQTMLQEILCLLNKMEDADTKVLTRVKHTQELISNRQGQLSEVELKEEAIVKATDSRSSNGFDSIEDRLHEDATATSENNHTVIVRSVSENRQEQIEQRDEKLSVSVTEELEASTHSLSERETIIHRINGQVENLQSLVRRLEQSNSLLGSLKDSTTVAPEKYFHYQELCDTLIRDQLRLKKKLESAERWNQKLLEHIEEIQKGLYSKALVENNHGKPPSDQQTENSNDLTVKTRTGMDGAPGNAERYPLHEINA